MDIQTKNMVDGIIPPTPNKKMKEQDKKVRLLVRVSAIFFVCAVVYSTIYLFVGKEPENAININTPGMATSTPTPVVRVESFTYNTAPIELTVEYPQLVHTASSTLEKSMNTKFKADAKKLYDSSLKELKNASSDFIKHTEIIPSTSTTASGTPAEPKTVVTYDRSVTFERKLAKEKTYIQADLGIVSLEYSQYTDTGGAHGTFFYGAQILDLNTGKELILKDILQGDYASEIVKNVDKQIRAAGPDCIRCDSLKDELKDLKVEIPESFVLTQNGITFLYSAYELGSYAATAGGQEVSVSKETLKDYILRPW